MLGLFINGVLYKTKPLKPGAFFWSEEISPYDKMEIITYRIIDQHEKILPSSEDFRIKSIELRGFQNNEKVLGVNAIKPFCFNQKNNVYCDIHPSAKINLLELPVYYYPEMLEIFINGNSVSYQSIYYKSYLLTTVAPKPGENHIQIRFRGLRFANNISLLFWGMWVLIFGVSLFRNFSVKYL
jgi:hypothetical protein